MNPPLPLLNQPPPPSVFKFGHNHPEVRTKEDLEFAKAAAGVTMNSQHIGSGSHSSPVSPKRTNSTASLASTATHPMNSGPGPIRSLLYPEGGHTNILKAITRRLSQFIQLSVHSHDPLTLPSSRHISTINQVRVGGTYLSFG